VYSEYIPFAQRACDFFTASPDPFHVLHNCTARLDRAGYQRLDTTAAFTGKLQPGGKYYYVVEGTTLVAFAVGGTLEANTPFGFHVIGGHTDSPNLKVKPRSQRAASGCTMLGVECYGGGLWHTWFDRDLSVSGRVLVQRTPVPSKSENNEEGRRGKTIYRHTEQRLINLQDPIARISTLCIHLQSADERKAFAVNKEKHTSPIIATTASATKSSNHHGVSGSHSNTNSQAILEQGATAQLNNSTWQDSQEPLLLQAIAHKLGLAVHEIVDFELNLYDTQPATLGGIQQEFVYSARLDNLATVFTGLEGLIDYTANDGSGADADVHFAESGDVAMAVFFDHEEIGSTSAQGANSVVMPAAIDRITAALYGGVLTSDVHGAVARRSFILSVDQAHAIHPNYSAKHEANHAPTLNGGVVIKTNSNQKYVLFVCALSMSWMFRVVPPFLFFSNFFLLLSLTSFVDCMDFHCIDSIVLDEPLSDTPRTASRASSCGKLDALPRCRSTNLWAATTVRVGVRSVRCSAPRREFGWSMPGCPSSRCILVARLWALRTLPTAAIYSRPFTSISGRSMRI